MNSRNSENALLCSDYAQVHLLGGPWDGAVIRLGKDFGGSEKLFIRPFFTIDEQGLLVPHLHPGFVSTQSEERAAPYNFAYTSEPELDENKNVRVRFYYIYDKLLRWKVTS